MFTGILPHHGRDFYPRSPCGERLVCMLNSPHGKEFLSTLSLRRATLEPSSTRRLTNISIHALLAESDREREPALSQSSEFLSTLSLRRATLFGALCWLIIKIFLSTLSLRRATSGNNSNMLCNVEFLSTLSLRRATKRYFICFWEVINFYPRSPCGERRWYACSTAHTARNFYPRSPCGERPGKGQSSGAGIGISIHALLAESDPG